MPNPNNEMTQAEKLASRLKQVLSEAGLHEITVFVSADKTVSFWVVSTKKVEGEQKSAIMMTSGK